MIRLSLFYLLPSGPLAATCVEQAVTPGNALLFLFAGNLVYLLVFVTSALWPAGGCAAERKTISPQTGISFTRLGRRPTKKKRAPERMPNYRKTGVFQHRQIK